MSNRQTGIGERNILSSLKCFFPKIETQIVLCLLWNLTIIIVKGVDLYEKLDVARCVILAKLLNFPVRIIMIPGTQW